MMQHDQMKTFNFLKITEKKVQIGAWNTSYTDMQRLKQKTKQKDGGNLSPL